MDMNNEHKALNVCSRQPVGGNPQIGPETALKSSANLPLNPQTSGTPLDAFPTPKVSYIVSGSGEFHAGGGAAALAGAGVDRGCRSARAGDENLGTGL